LFYNNYLIFLAIGLQDLGDILLGRMNTLIPAHIKWAANPYPKPKG
jgi:hypothetical protein